MVVKDRLMMVMVAPTLVFQNKTSQKLWLQTFLVHRG